MSRITVADLLETRDEVPLARTTVRGLAAVVERLDAILERLPPEATGAEPHRIGTFTSLGRGGSCGCYSTTDGLGKQTVYACPTHRSPTPPAGTPLTERERKILAVLERRGGSYPMHSGDAQTYDYARRLGDIHAILDGGDK